MKKHLLTNLSLIIMLFLSGNSMFAQYELSQVIWKYDDENGAPINEGDDVALGSTVYYSITYSSPIDTRINPMQRCHYAEGFSGQAWPNLGPIIVSAGTGITVTGNRVLMNTEGLKTSDQFDDTQEAIFKLALVGAPTANKFHELNVNYTAAENTDPITVMTNAFFEAQPDVTFGSTIDFTVNYVIADDDVNEYELVLMQVSALGSTGLNQFIHQQIYSLTSVIGNNEFEGSFLVSSAIGDDNLLDGQGFMTFRLRILNNAGDVNDIKITTDFSTTSTSIGSSNDAVFKLYPNPATADIFVEVEQGSVIEICNVAGSLVKTQVASSNKQYISVANLAKGMYVVKVKLNGESLTKKLLIK